MTLKLVRRGDGWWIVGHDDGDFGPYAVRREADEDRAGLERTRKHGHRRSFWTSEPATSRRAQPTR